MKGKKLVENTLDLLVKMADHCAKMEKPKNSSSSKCANCGLSWNFGLGSNGCLLVEIVDDNTKFMDDLTAACEFNNIEYKSKLKKIADIFVTESD